MIIKQLILQTKKLSDFLRGKSKFFHSIMINGKKEIMKKLYFVFRKVMLCIFPVEYNECLIGIKLKRYLGFSFLKILIRR